MTARVDELGEAVRALSWQLPEITQELAALRDQVEGADVTGAVTTASEELTERLRLHTDMALAGVLRLLDERLSALRRRSPRPPPSCRKARRDRWGSRPVR